MDAAERAVKRINGKLGMPWGELEETRFIAIIRAEYAELVDAADEAKLFLLDAHRDMADSPFANTYSRLSAALRKVKP